MWGALFPAGASVDWNIEKYSRYATCSYRVFFFLSLQETQNNLYVVCKIWSHLVKTWKDAPTVKADTRQSVRSIEKLPKRSSPRQV